MAAHRSVIIGLGATLREVIAREVSVGEMRDFFVEADHGPRDFFAAVAFDDCGLDDLAFLSNSTVAELEAYPATELENLRIACKELNPGFFRCRALIDTAARALQAEAQQMLSTATASG